VKTLLVSYTRKDHRHPRTLVLCNICMAPQYKS